MSNGHMVTTYKEMTQKDAIKHQHLTCWCQCVCVCCITCPDTGARRSTEKGHGVQVKTGRDETEWEERHFSSSDQACQGERCINTSNVRVVVDH